MLRSALNIGLFAERSLRNREYTLSLCNGPKAAATTNRGIGRSRRFEALCVPCYALQRHWARLSIEKPGCVWMAKMVAGSKKGLI